MITPWLLLLFRPACLSSSFFFFFFSGSVFFSSFLLLFRPLFFFFFVLWSRSVRGWGPARVGGVGPLRWRWRGVAVPLGGGVRLAVGWVIKYAHYL